ncbi:ANTAR domain-containing protein [Blastococcus saxobsidens]|uniref:ANTAR domain-containing protein n=1 Tax=Blastococcus saxobsidens TaxID=138336 RepID=A0A4Q7Y7P3_9ACTN|nr:ANTAR domain-containing protein [Blastococcus saxobsidens]RZU32950.1 ANTAR domain-containing protein [Blastococcus saxobsidens]
MVPGPRPSDERDGPAPTVPAVDRSPGVALARTARGWAVIPVPGSTTGELVGDVVEGMTLADLVADELGGLPEPDRDARRSARGPSGVPGDTDPVDVRVAALERTIAQLEHALASRVSTERAIGVLAERHGTSLRAAFEELRRQARTAGRPVVDLAREVLDGLTGEASAAVGAAAPVVVPTTVLRPQPAPQDVVAAADGRS